ncbi:MAG: PAS domain S-box protein, partial [Thermomicrobiales bacterium]|nr:PAS domain S-box protein [Thermomicrobiales bacterium]
YRDAQAAEARYRGLFEGTRDGIMLFEHGGMIVAANPALRAMSGFDLPRLLGMHALDLTADDIETAEAQFAALQATGEWRGESDLRCADGSTLPVEAWVAALDLPTGRTFVASMRDVSERRAFEQTQEIFLSTVAHDLKNPLAAVRGQAQLLQRRLDKGTAMTPEKLRSSIDGIDGGAQRMGLMIDDLVDVFRMRGNQPLALHRQPVDLVDLVRRLVDEADRVNERHHVRAVSAEPTLVGSWDEPRLERVIANLLGNAIKYSPDGGDITISLRREAQHDGSWAVVVVEDHGVGIPPADLPFVFERFRRAGNARGFGGSGIGLAGARLIVEAHGGTVGAESIEGGGSTFTVRLPLANT